MKKFEQPAKTTAMLRAIIAALIVVLVVLIAVAVSQGSKENPTDKQTGDMNVPQNVIATPYCELKYPALWEDQMTVETSTADETASYAFCAQIEGKRYELYAVHFGNSAPGNLLGYLPHNGSVVPVYIECYSIPDRNELTESELSLILAMMEGVNDVAQSIRSTSGYDEP